MTSPRVEIAPDPQSLAERLADFIAERFAATTGRFALNLSGGSTPQRLYRLLATEIYRRKFDWERVYVFLGDERFVPHDHPASNYGMIRQTLLAHVPIPDENVFPVDTSLPSPGEAAAAYARTLKAYYGKETLDMERPLFQFTLLGLGDDGHTASLIPGSAALDERERWVTDVIGFRPEPRITMTYPILESSDALVFEVEGSGKTDILGRLLHRDTSIPAGRVTPRGAFYVFCDAAAKGDVPA